jgi:hypothetical protein
MKIDPDGKIDIVCDDITGPRNKLNYCSVRRILG